ncbi:MAG: PAC2 family protein [Chloroflexi bacterium]|nr:PAC2 family protein [Chloroflexota bacterium]
MENLIISQQPVLHSPLLVVAFAGWPDAQEGATYAVRHLVERLGARKCARIDSEEFYNFQRTRPIVYLTEQGERAVHWPSNDFYAWHGDAVPHDLLLMHGLEPYLRWRTFCNLIVDMAQQSGVSQVVVLGALLDAIPHTREHRVSGTATTPELRTTLEEMGVQLSRYQGPTGIASALMEACQQRGLPYCSLWGHAPHYIQMSPNPKVSLVLLKRLSKFLEWELPLEDLYGRCASFDAEVNKAAAGNAEAVGYIRKLETAYDQAQRSGQELPQPEEVVKDVEEFLRRQPHERGDGPSLGP